jgi:putrescine---pyruvate transaminase
MTGSRLWHPFAAMSEVAEAEFVLERGDDVWLYDTDGQRYFDGTASLWYANVGHGRREIHEAIAEQLAKLEAYSIFGDYTTPPARELADRLAALAPIDDARIFLTSGGGEAIDTAAKLARRYWHARGEAQRTMFLSREGGYHGTNGIGTALGGIAANRDGMGPLLPDVEYLPYDSVDALSDAIERLGPENIAAFFCEPVIGAGGVLPPPPGYIEGAAFVCREHGILFVVDTVICGFGRLGTWFGIERWPVTPDMICFAKGVTSGYLPLGGVVVSGEIAQPFYSPGGPVFRHGPTYAGHATCCAAALANIDLLERDGLITRGRELESEFHGALGALTDLPAVDHVRGGVGLLGAVEFSPELIERMPDASLRGVAAARKAGLLLRPLATSLALSPPLTATGEHIEFIVSALQEALTELWQA